MEELEKAVRELEEKATALSHILQSIEPEANGFCAKKLSQMNIPEKLRLAKFLVGVHKAFEKKGKLKNDRRTVATSRKLHQ